VSREPLLLLRDIENSCAKVIRYSQGLTRDEVFADELRLDGILLNLHIIGEAVKGLPDDLRGRHSDVPWREIAGMRDLIAHAYFALDLGIVWDVIQNGVPKLLDRVREITASEAAD
jgi:uncharacterized protein with HEPN domain